MLNLSHETTENGSGILNGRRIQSKYASYWSLGWQTDRKYNRTQTSGLLSHFSIKVGCGSTFGSSNSQSWKQIIMLLFRYYCDHHWIESIRLYSIGTKHGKRCTFTGLPSSYIGKMLLEAIVVRALVLSSAQQILIFKRFRSAWSNIDQHKFSIVSSDP